MTMDRIPNRFLRTQDLSISTYRTLRSNINEYYVSKLKGTPHPWGSKNPNSVITHWSRDWEYPWAIINSEVKSEHKLLDCGCGGSPLLPYIVDNVGCLAYGIDQNYGNNIISNPKDYIDAGNIICNLRDVFVDLALITNNRYTIQQGDMTSLPYDNEYFDRVFCISVIEHLKTEDIGFQSIKEMVRVLKPGGRLLITMDHTSYNDHVKSWCLGQYKKIIEWSGIKLMGESDFTVPSKEDIDGYYKVLGFVLEKEL